MKAKVAAVRTSPDTVLDDIQRLMDLAGYQEALPKGVPTMLKINISWQHYYPACSTSPWQLEGTIRALRQGGYDELIAAHNGTVVVSAREGEINNKHRLVTDAYGLQNVHLEEPPVQWIRFQPKAKMLVLNDIFPDGITIPDFFIGKNIVQLPTVKTHVFTGTTGAMKNAFGGLLNHNRHWTHAVIHETLGDLLAIQKEIHPGIFAVMDGSIAGEGPGPRVMTPHVKNILLASADQTAIDAVAARLMGFNPLQLRYIRLAHDRGLGVGHPRQIELVGDDIAGENWHFKGGQTFASVGQWAIYHGPLKPLEKLLLRTKIAPWSFFASNMYFNHYWYRIHGRRRVQAALQSGWGELFRTYRPRIWDEDPVGATAQPVGSR